MRQVDFVCVFFMDDFIAKLRISKLDLKDDTQNKYVVKTFTYRENMFTRP